MPLQSPASPGPCHGAAAPLPAEMRGTEGFPGTPGAAPSTQPVKLGVPAFHLACGKREFGEFICPCHVVNGWQSTPE
ncbi:hypothetical protein NN561_011439 [Cricetulus griseus]